MKNRIYLNEPISPDHESWKMCYNCGTIVPVYELEKEASIKDVVETIDNPFDQGKDFLGIDSRKARRKIRNKKELFGDINDDEAQRELSTGNTLISYFEYQPQ